MPLFFVIIIVAIRSSEPKSYSNINFAYSRIKAFCRFAAVNLAWWQQDRTSVHGKISVHNGTCAAR